ncbi:hypothetical protein EDD85DRAFT_792549 [Armillaria nabsnona]|nr:hypothetical protein EDD85DRAFT_792549 [Armillaria nabsnona]
MPPSHMCPSIHVFTASDHTLIRSVILPNLEQISVPGWVTGWLEELVVADAQAVPSLLSMIKRSQCQTTLMVISMKDMIITEEIIGITKLAPALDKWVFLWQKWCSAYHDPLEKLINGMAEKTITSIDGTAFTLLPVLTTLNINMDYHPQGDCAPQLYFVGEPLASAMEAWLGTHFGVVVRMVGWQDHCRPLWIFPNLSPDIQCRLLVCQGAGNACSIGLSGFELLGNCVYNFYGNFVHDFDSLVVSENSAELENYVRVVDDLDDDDLDG